MKSHLFQRLVCGNEATTSAITWSEADTFRKDHRAPTPFGIRGHYNMNILGSGRTRTCVSQLVSYRDCCLNKSESVIQKGIVNSTRLIYLYVSQMS